MDFFEDFAEHDVPVPQGSVHVRTAGSGTTVLLLHGYPQTQAMWHAVAPALVRDRRVAAADLRGYGRSTAATRDLTFRAMAADLVALMDVWDLPRVDVVAHDRGARVAHRLALDHPDRVQSLTLLDINPTVDVWRLMNGELARRYWHWSFLAQSEGLPQRLIGAEPIFFLHRSLEALTGSLEVFDPRALADYEAAARRPSVVDAWCEDYRTATGVDLEHDRADAGRVLDVPALVLWGHRGVVGAFEDPLTQWATRFASVSGRGIDAGHFLAEERPEEVLGAVLTHLGEHGLA